MQHIEARLKDIKHGTAVIATCLVQTIEETHPGFTQSLLSKLGKAYGEVREEAGTDQLELINWTRELITGWNIVSGQGRPFLDGQ